MIHRLDRQIQPRRDLGIAQPVVEVVSVVESPLRKLAVLRSGRADEADREWIRQRGVRRNAAIFREVHSHIFVPGRAHVLEIRGHVESVKQPGAAAHHSLVV